MRRKGRSKGSAGFAQPYKGTSDDTLLALAATEEDRTDRLGRLWSRNGGFSGSNGFSGQADESITPAHFEGAWETMSVRSRP